MTASPLAASADDTKRACVRSAETGQRLRDEGKPLAARTELLACGRESCPAVVRAHCARWLEQVEATIPTVVLQAHAASPGGPVDVTDVTVALDGAQLLPSLDGQPRRVEPGRHTFTFTRAGSPPVQSSILLVAGERNRRVTAEFTSPPSSRLSAAAPPSSAAPVRSDAPSVGTTTSTGSTSIRPAAWVFAGLAVVGAGGFAYFGATGKSELDSLRASCAGHCTPSAVSAAWNKLIVSDVSLAVGAVSAGMATWLFLSPHHTEAPPEPSAVSGLLLGPNGHGLTFGWHGAF